MEPLFVTRVLKRDDKDPPFLRALREDRRHLSQRRDRRQRHKKVAGTFTAKVPATFFSLFVRHAAAAG